MQTIGTSLPRVDGRAKVTGAARYVDDLRPEGCLYGATVRSTRAHARVLGIRRDPTYDWTGITLVTARDIPGENVVNLMTDDQPVLAHDRVRHVTEPIALVAAPSRDRALDAAAHVQITYEDLPAVIDPEQSMDGPVRIYDGGDGQNVFKHIEIHHNEGTPPEGDLLWHEGTYSTGLHEQLYLEPQGMIAIPGDDGRMTVIGSMQCPYYIVRALRRVLALGDDPDHKLAVIHAVTGGAFGGKEDYPSMIASHAVLLARATGAPVKLIYRRGEDLRATTKRHPAIMRIRSAVTPDGVLRRWDVRMLMDGGAYNTLTPVVLSRGVLHAAGAYRCGEVHIVGDAVATNTPPAGAFRGFGAPQAIWAVERHMDRIARALGLDPVALRRKNLYREGDQTPTGQVLRNPGAFAVLDDALQAAQVPAPLPQRRPGGGPLARRSAGRGVSIALHGAGFTGNGEAWLKGKVGIELRDGVAHVLTASTDMGQASDTTLAQVVVDALDCRPDQVVVDVQDSSKVPDSGPTAASRTMMVVGGIAIQAAHTLRRALEAETGKVGASFDELVAARGSATPLRVIQEYEDLGQMEWDPDTYQGDAYPTYGWSCSVVDLDVDLDTGEVLYRRFISTTDVGVAINPTVVVGQLDGGVLQALGWATMEEVVRDDQGLMRNDSITNYIIPTSADAPELVSRYIEIPHDGVPHGAKGIGEIPLDGPAPAVAQGIEDATGLVLNDLPMTPERVLAGLDATEAK